MSPTSEAVAGLQALAISQIIFFHSGGPFFSNGYAGFAIYFTISGYLAVSSLLDNQAKGFFNLLQFYAQRAKKLIVSLIILILITIFTSYIFSQKSQSKESFYSATLFIENYDILLNTEIEYNQLIKELTTPVLHFWMVSVEEQFCLFLPIFFTILCVRIRIKYSRLIKFLFCLILLNILANFFVSLFSPAVVIFSTPNQSFQFISGAILAVLHWQLQTEEFSGLGLKFLSSLGNLLSCIGFLLVLIVPTNFFYHFSIMSVNSIACFSCFLLICGLEFADEHNYIKKILSSSTFAGAGKISYSIFLWHFPVIIFFKHLHVLPVVSVPNPAPYELFIILTCSIFLGILSWFLFEKKIYQCSSDHSASQRYLFLLTIALLVTSLLSVSIFLHPDPSFPLNNHLILLNTPTATPSPSTTPSSSPSPSPSPSGFIVPSSTPSPTPSGSPTPSMAPSRSSLPETQPVIMFAGDSFVEEWISAMGDLSTMYKFVFINVFEHGCPWFDLDKNVHRAPGKIFDCHELLHKIDEVYSTYTPDLSIFVTYSIVEFAIEPADGSPSIPVMSAGWLDYIEARLRKALPYHISHSKKVVILKSHSAPSSNVPQCVSNLPVEILNARNWTACDFPAVQSPGQIQVNDLFTKLSSEFDFTVISLDPIICPNGVCPALVNNTMTFRDVKHIAIYWARYMAIPFYNQFLNYGIDLACPTC